MQRSQENRQLAEKGHRTTIRTRQKNKRSWERKIKRQPLDSRQESDIRLFLLSLSTTPISRVDGHAHSYITQNKK